MASDGFEHDRQAAAGPPLIVTPTARSVGAEVDIDGSNSLRGTDFAADALLPGLFNIRAVDHGRSRAFDRLALCRGFPVFNFMR
ncbi:hypothetical protein [Stratiformator vulcanicus]|uniref:hypothetical protein n=1 Tax=Stratiformator vulcanicus TaxID=2527980 RepID=UPI00119F9DF5|nr:hypothetical protein [Stratiformator vulcanicus]